LERERERIAEPDVADQAIAAVEPDLTGDEPDEVDVAVALRAALRVLGGS